ncbi:hypothetical protein KI387_013448 [Taxus chinensis]|uniref:LysM domain-containing protein n=1 Tax=Taxus chinensis TaxID=29808 RepID=A0AA38CK01_TAXCH|nr:hypothetical protein KI387_013448 [Taxus chinensis]
MGCFGDSDDDLLWEELISSTRREVESHHHHILHEKCPEIQPDQCDQVLNKDLWRSILERLSAAELGRAACVCRTWNSIASETEVQINAFKAPWKLKEIVGRPSSTSFFHATTLSRFAISHKLKRSDTIPGLAIKYQVHVTDIRRLNNMMSDHGIYSRERLLIPVSKPDILMGGRCYIERDIYARREVAVLYLDGAPDGKASYIANTSPEKSNRRLLDSIRRSLQTDDGTAEYYLSISNGNLRTAFAQFSQDLSWEQGHGI